MTRCHGLAEDFQEDGDEEQSYWPICLLNRYIEIDYKGGVSDGGEIEIAYWIQNMLF